MVVDVLKLRQKEYYIKLLETLKMNGLIAITKDLVEDSQNINYIKLTLTVLGFLQKNKKLFRNFTQNTFEKILVLSIDEICRINNIQINQDDLRLVLDLLKSSFLIKRIALYIKDIALKLYYSTQCCKKVTTEEKYTNNTV